MSKEPLYLSIKSPKTSDNQDGDIKKGETGKLYMEDSKYEGRKTKEIYEHKVRQLIENDFFMSFVLKPRMLLI